MQPLASLAVAMHHSLHNIHILLVFHQRAVEWQQFQALILRHQFLGIDAF